MVDRSHLKSTLLQRHGGILTNHQGKCGRSSSLVGSQEPPERAAIFFMILFWEKTLGSPLEGEQAERHEKGAYQPFYC